MGRRTTGALRLGAAISVLAALPAAAQNRSGDNAVTQAEDAFGVSIGRETLGIYSSSNARGFSPSAAGNVRVEGLYFDPVYLLTSILADSVSVKVGLSAQSYPFAAPRRSEEHTSELQSLMRISSAVFCMKKKKIHHTKTTTT